MIKSRSERALWLFTALVIPFMLWQTLDWSPRSSFVVTDSSDGTVELKREVPLRIGQKIFAHTVVHTQLAPATLTHKSTQLVLDKRTIMEVKSISSEEIRLFSSRGHWNIHPDRTVTSCTRAVCVETASPIEIFYYTPGEVVEIRSSGDTTVTFKGQEFQLRAGDRMTIDELTGAIHKPNAPVSS